tara:strand:+ start:4605 stop:5039 length:435 start_codon:yes stop_codon:yes gene_type:complete
MGRRSKLNAEVQKRIIQAIQSGATYELAAQFGGVTRTTLFYWLNKGEEQTKGIYRTFFNEFKKAEAICCVAALAVIKQEAKNGTWQAAAWLLERRFPEQYSKNGPPPVQLTIDVDEISIQGLTQEYNTYVRPLIDGPTIDLDEE